MRTLGIALLAGAGLLAASPALAQSMSATLEDGRVFTAGGGGGACQAPVRSQDPDGSIGLDYQCTVADLDGGVATVAGLGAVVILPASMGAGTAEGFLRHHQQQWWPQTAAADLPAPTRETKRTANGSVAVLCIHRDNVEALNGDALCVIDQSGLQILIGGQSTMAFTADNVIDAVLAGSTVR